MKIFDRDNKWNFVDDNNVFVGYDNQSQCCENFGYLLTLNESDELDVDSEQIEASLLEGYNFDIKYMVLNECGSNDDNENHVRFKLTKEHAPDVFLTLYNVHNGYYSHGFDVIHGVECIGDGLL